MDSDPDLRDVVVEVLKWEPGIDSTHIAVVANNGVVELSGHVGSYKEKLHAECLVQKIRGVRGIAQNIEVRLPEKLHRHDDEIAERAARVLEWNNVSPGHPIHVKVEKGLLSLSGKVEWDYQRRYAETVTGQLGGVKGIINLITVKMRPTPNDVKLQIETAFKHEAGIDCSDIKVSAFGHQAILDGTVHTLHERELALITASAAPGIKNVVDNLKIVKAPRK